MKIIFPGLSLDTPNIQRIHKLLASMRCHHSFHLVKHGFFHEPRGKAELIESLLLEIHSPLNTDELETQLKELDWSESEAEFIYIIKSNDEYMINLRGWTFGFNKGESNG